MALKNSRKVFIISTMKALVLGSTVVTSVYSGFFPHPFAGAAPLTFAKFQCPSLNSAAVGSYHIPPLYPRITHPGMCLYRGQGNNSFLQLAFYPRKTLAAEEEKQRDDICTALEVCSESKHPSISGVRAVSFSATEKGIKKPHKTVFLASSKDSSKSGIIELIYMYPVPRPGNLEPAWDKFMQNHMQQGGSGDDDDDDGND